MNTPEGFEPREYRAGGASPRGERRTGPARQAEAPERGPSRPSGAWRSLAEASESIASLVAVVLLHGPTSSGGVRHYRTMATRSAQLWWARNTADSVSPQGDHS